MMKKILAAILTMAMLVSVVGCSQSEGQSSAASSDGQSSSQAGSSEASSEASGEKIQLTFMQTTSGSAEYYEPTAEKVAAMYTEVNPNVEVTVQHVGDNYYEVLMTAVAANEAPDASVGWSPTPLQYAAAGEALPLDSIIEKWEAEGNEMLTDIPQDYYDFYKYEDHYYGIPYRVDPRVITYRTDMFEEAGITELPKTWDDFEEVCAKLLETFPDKIPFIIAGAEFMPTHAVIGFGANNGTGFVNENLEPNMTSPEFIEILAFFRDLYANGYISAGSASYASADAEKLFTSGEGAMVYLGAPAFVQNSDVEEFCAIMPPLQGPSGDKQQTYAWITGAFALSQTEHPQETLDFLEWWSQNTKILFTEGRNNSMPCRTSHQNDPEIANNWVRSETIAAMQYGCVTNAYPAPSLYPEFSQIEGEGIAGNALRDVMAGETDIEAIAEKYNAQVAAVFE